MERNEQEQSQVRECECCGLKYTLADYALQQVDPEELDSEDGLHVCQIFCPFCSNQAAGRTPMARLIVTPYDRPANAFSADVRTQSATTGPARRITFPRRMGTRAVARITASLVGSLVSRFSVAMVRGYRRKMREKQPSSRPPKNPS